MRPSWDVYFCELAKLTATRATCTRRKVGCVITRDNRVLATGYNGALPGEDHCTEVGCFMIGGHCIRTNHAEVNAINDAAKRGVSLDGSTVYVTLQPCWNCLRQLISVGVKRVYYTERYPVDHELYARYHTLHDKSFVKYLNLEVVG